MISNTCVRLGLCLWDLSFCGRERGHILSAHATQAARLSCCCIWCRVLVTAKTAEDKLVGSHKSTMIVSVCLKLSAASVEVNKVC